MSHHNHEIDLSQLKKNERVALLATLSLVSAACALELIGGHATKSLGLFSDALHLFGDIVSIMIALVAHWMSSRGNGHTNAELWSALINAITLMVMALYLGVQGVKHVLAPQDIETTSMLVFSLGCCLCDCIALGLLNHYQDNPNIQGVYLHIWSDMFATVAVAIGAAIMWRWHAPWIDGALSVMVSSIVGWQALSLSKNVWHDLRKSTSTGNERGAP